MEDADLLEVLVARDDVDMRVEQAWQQGLPRAIDPIVTVEIGPDLDDPPVLDPDVALRESGSGPVEQSTCVEDDARHRFPFPCVARA